MSGNDNQKIAILIADGLEGKGGIERIMLYLTRELRLQQPDLPFFIQQTRFGASQLTRHATTPLALAQFTARCAAGKVRLAHVNMAPRGSTWRKMLFVRAARAARVPVVLHLHGSGYDEYFATQSASRQHRIRELFQTVDQVVVLGDHWYRFALETLGVAPERLTVVENGVPAPAGVASPDGTIPTVVFMGQVSIRKGIDVLLPALAAVARNGDQFRARIGGNGDLDQWRALAQREGIADRVEFLGWVDETVVDQEMRGGDIFVLPSRAENQPVAIIEAMARGLPVISTDIGAIPETVVHEECGFIVPAGDVEALAAALGKLIRDPQLRLQMGSRGRARWQKNYSIASVAEAMATIYRKIL